VISQLFTFPSTIERLRQGPLSEYLDTYAAAVAEQGYALQSISRQVVAIADFSRWLKHKHSEIEALDDRVVGRFLGLRRRQQRVGRGDPRALDRMLSLLRQKGIVKPCQPPVTDNARSNITAGFHYYLLQDLGRSASTVRSYVPFIDQFLLERFHDRTPNLAALRAPDVTGFVIRNAHQLSPVRAGLMVTALRSFFRYLLHRGAIATDLAGCVPAVPKWSLSTLPRFLPAAAVERLLKRCGRKTAVGRRNHAILLLLARLGLRAGEVVKLNLDDIDWDSGLITIHGKGGRSAKLPLPVDVGTALAAYLRRDRPPSTSRRVFLRHRAPFDWICQRLYAFRDRQTRSESCRRRVGTHGRPCASALASHEHASAGRVTG
jgi:site-specific recombinase XerD